MEFSEEQDDWRENSNYGNDQEAGGSAGRPIPGRDYDRKLFIGGLSRHTTERELTEYFSKFGTIESATVKVDPYSGQTRCSAYIVFCDPATINKLLASDDHYINKRKVHPKRVLNLKETQQGEIFVSGLTPEIEDTALFDHFSQYGTIVMFRRPYDKVKNQGKCYSFLTFESKEVVIELLKEPNQVIAGKKVHVRKAKVNPDVMMHGAGRGPGLGHGFGCPELSAYLTYENAMASGVFGGGYDNYEYSGPAHVDYSSSEYDGPAPVAFGAGSYPRGGRPYLRHFPY